MNVDTQKLIEARIGSGLTFEEIESAGIARQTIWRIEKGLSKPHGKTVHKLCDIYKKHPSYFLKGGE